MSILHESVMVRGLDNLYKFYSSKHTNSWSTIII